MKQDLPYFTHDNNAHDHPKMRALRVAFGWAGYGQFWALNEMVASAPEARLDLSRRINRMAAAECLGLTLDGLNAFLSFLADPEIDLIIDEAGTITTDRTREDYAQVEAARAAARERKPGPRKSSGELPQSSPELPQSSPELCERAEQSRAEQKEEQLAAREAVPVDNPEPEPEPEADPDPELLAFCLRLAIERKARNPPAMARKLLTEADVQAAFAAARAPPTRELTAIPAPRIPCACGGELRSGDRTAECRACGRFYGFDFASRSWQPDPGYNPRAGPLAMASESWEDARRKLRLERKVQ